MKKFKVGDKVWDSWWPWRKGKVVKVLKTRVHIHFDKTIWDYASGIWNYDKAHFSFLRLMCDKHPKYKALRKPRTCKMCWRMYRNEQ